MSRLVLFLVMVAAVSGCSKDAGVETANSEKQSEPKKSEIKTPPANQPAAASVQEKAPPKNTPPGKPPALLAERVKQNQARTQAYSAGQSKKAQLESAFAGAAMQVEDGHTVAVSAFLHPVKEEIPQLETSSKSGASLWNRRRLNEHGKRFDAFRFRAPPDGPVEIYLCLAFGGTLPQWDFSPIKHSAPRLAAKVFEWNTTVESLDLPNENILVFARFAAVPADSEHLLWIMRDDREPWDANIAITFLPADSNRRADNAESIAQVMGIKYQAPRFAADAEGVNGALQFVKSLLSRNAQRATSFSTTLRAVAPALPELMDGGEGEIVWNKITLNKSGHGVDAFRFRCPRSSPSELRYVIAAPRGREFDFGIITPHGKVRGMNVKLEVDLQLPGVDLPPENITLFKHILDGQFRAGEEYLIWVSSGDGPPQPTVLGLHFSAPGPEPDYTTSRQIAKEVGIALPETVEPSRVVAARRICRAWQDKGGGLVDEALQSVAGALPEVRISPMDGDLVWNTLTLNSDGVGFDAVRFKAPFPVPSDLFCVLTNSQDVQWRLLPAEGYGARLSDMRHSRALPFEGLDTAPDSQVTFAAVSAKQGFWSIMPDREYVIWFRTPDPATPREVRFALRVVPEASGQSFATARQIAARLGLFPAAESLPPGGKILGRHNHPVVDVAFSGDGTRLASLDKRGTLKLWEPDSGRLVDTLSLEGPQKATRFVLSPDGKRAAVALADPAALVIWDIEKRTNTPHIPMSATWFSDFDFSPDGAQMAILARTPLPSGGFSQELGVWQIGAARQTVSIHVKGPFITRLRWLDNGRLMGVGNNITRGNASGSSTASVLKIWKPETLEQIEDRSEGAGSLVDLAVAKSAGLIAATGLTRTSKLWSTGDMQELPALSTFDSSKAIALSSDGRLAVVAGDVNGLDLTVEVWDLERRRPLFFRKLPTGPIERLALSPDHKWYAVAANDLAVELGDTTFPDPNGETNSLGMKLVRIPAGSFPMGTPTAEQRRNSEDAWWRAHLLKDNKPTPDMPLHNVVITRPFFMSMHEVTVGQFRRFVEETGYKTTAETNSTGGAHLHDPAKDWQYRPEYNWRNPGFVQDDNHPAVQISWLDAQAFCKWLSAKEVAPYRLPTEAEWEYACRAGTTSEWNYGHSFDRAGFVGNVADLAIQKQYGKYPTTIGNWNDGFAFTSPVGSYCPNSFGLYDMHGNAIEWCSDWYDPKYYEQSGESDPQGPSTGKNRVQRGGCFSQDAKACNSAYRQFDKPEAVQSVGGFRVVREIP